MLNKHKTAYFISGYSTIIEAVDAQVKTAFRDMVIQEQEVLELKQRKPITIKHSNYL